MENEKKKQRLFGMLSTHAGRGAMRRNRCSFVKVGLTETRNPSGNEVNAQFFAKMLPIHSAGFHGGLCTLRPEALAFHTLSCHHGNDTKNQMVDVAPKFLLCV